MRRLPLPFLVLAGSLFLGVAASPSQAAVPPSAPVTAIDGLGQGTAALNGPWQFHLGDAPSWADPQAHDATGIGGWEQLAGDKTWGAQVLPSYAGYGWYRIHLHLTPASGASPDFALLLQRVEDVYEIYWNGQLVAHYGKMPPHPTYYYQPAAQTFGLNALYRLVFALSLLAWLRNQSQNVLLAMATYSGARAAGTILLNLRIPWSFDFALGAFQLAFTLGDVGLWFLLLYLLKLDKSPRLARFTRILAIVTFTAGTLDGLLTFLDWSNPFIAGWAQLSDGVLTFIVTIVEIFPLILVGLALRKRLDLTR
jgi:diguanylate cyclase